MHSFCRMGISTTLLCMILIVQGCDLFIIDDADFLKGHLYQNYLEHKPSQEVCLIHLPEVYELKAKEEQFWRFTSINGNRFPLYLSHWIRQIKEKGINYQIQIDRNHPRALPQVVLDRQFPTLDIQSLRLLPGVYDFTVSYNTSRFVHKPGGFDSNPREYFFEEFACQPNHVYYLHLDKDYQQILSGSEKKITWKIWISDQSDKGHIIWEKTEARPY